MNKEPSDIITTLHSLHTVKTYIEGRKEFMPSNVYKEMLDIVIHDTVYAVTKMCDLLTEDTA